MTPRRASKLLAPAALLFLLAVGAILRFERLSQPSFSADEYQTVHIVRAIQQSGRLVYPSGVEYRRGWPYSYAAALSATLGGTGEFSIRLPGVLFGLLTILLAYFAVSNLIHRPAALGVCALLAFSSLSVLLSRYARMYSMHQFLGLLTLWLGYLCLNETSAPRRRILAAGAAAALLFNFFVHELALLYLAALAAFAVFGGLAERGKDGSFRGARFAAALAVLAAAAASIPPLRRQILEPSSWLLEKFLAPRFVPMEFSYWNFLGEQYGFWKFLFIPGAAYLYLRDRRLCAYVVLNFAVPYAVLSLSPLRAERYFSTIQIPFLILMSCGAFALWEAVLRGSLGAAAKLGGRFSVSVSLGRRLSGLVAVVGFFTVLGGVGASGEAAKSLEIMRTEKGAFYGIPFFSWRETGTFLRDRLLPGDLVVSQAGPPIDYYAGRLDFVYSRSKGDLYHEFIVVRDGAYVDRMTGKPCLMEFEELRRIIEAHPRIWLVVPPVIWPPIPVANAGWITQSQGEYLLSRFEHVYQNPEGTMVILKKKP